MLNIADLAGLDLSAMLALSARLDAAALHQDRCRRQAARFEVPDGFLGTAQAVEEMDAHAAAIADGARLVSLMARLLADENQSRPAPVLRRVPRSAPPAASPSRIGIMARCWARLAGTPTAEVA